MNLLVGLTGGIGSGKSEVGKIFAGLGAFLIDADLLAREAVTPGSGPLQCIHERWPQTRNLEGGLDREVLAGIVFSNAEELKALVEILHPVVRELMRLRRRDASPGQIVVHEVPLLFEGGTYREMDYNVLVVAPWEQRIARVMARSGCTREQVVQRMAAQIRPEDAAKLANATLHNDSDLVHLEAEARRVYAELERLAVGVR